jgi:Alkaline phosphatase PhoX
VPKRLILGLLGAALVVAAPIAAATLATTSRGPSTTTDPYVLPVASGVSTKSILTVSDDGSAGNGYELVGIPDGLGAKEGRSGDFELFMNHELTAAAGAVRAHGQKGAFVSHWKIDEATLKARKGEDLIQPGVTYWDYVTQSYGTTPSTGGPNPRHAGDVFPPQIAAFARFCSGSLTDPGQLSNPSTGRGFRGQLYFGNEENGNEGRSFAVTEDGRAQQLPRLGLFSWENTLAAPNRSDTTLVMGQEDAADGQLWVYVGTKTRQGNPFDRAGLTNGTDYVIDLKNEAVSTDAGFRTTYGKGTPADADLAEVGWDLSGATQNAIAKNVGLSLNRIEDGAWDPSHPNDFYFVTTEGGKGADVPTGSFGRDGGGLWRLRFADIENPAAGATLTLLLDGSEAPFLNKPDNMDIDEQGNVLLQEDPGSNVHVARIVAYQIATGKRGVLARFDPAQFAPVTPGGTDARFTIDEESSGIIDVEDILGRGWFLFDAQVHKANPDPALVEYGQLLAMHVDDFAPIYTLD